MTLVDGGTSAVITRDNRASNKPAKAPLRTSRACDSSL